MATCLQDLMRFCAFALLLQISIFCLYIEKARHFYHGPQEVVQRVVNVLIAAVPTGLATVLVFSLGTCVKKLKSQKIDLLQPEKIKTIANVDVVCFDKTGTLTRSVVSPAEFCCMPSNAQCSNQRRPSPSAFTLCCQARVSTPVR